MDRDQLISELQFKAIRSSGAGGQHVNKVSSKVELMLAVNESKALTDAEKSLILKNLSNRITKYGVLILQCDETRSQHKNKELVIKRCLALVENAVIMPKLRKKLRPSRAAKLRRMQNKKRNAEKKANRKKPYL